MAGRRWTASSLLLRLRQEHTVLGRDVDTDVDVDSDLGPTQKCDQCGKNREWGRDREQ